MSTDRPAPPRTPNRQLAALISEAGFSHAGLARRVDQLGLEHGLDLRYDKTSVTRWLRGQQPRGTTPALIAEVFTRRLGRRLTAQDLGLDACAPVYAGLEFAAGPGEAIDIVSGLWRKDTGHHAELRKIAFTSAGLVVPSRDWLIGRPDERVASVPSPAAARVPTQGGRPGAPPAARAEAYPLQERGPGEPVTSGDIAALRSVGEMFRALDQAHGGGHARPALVRYLELEVEPMLRGVYGEQTGRRLFGAAAELTRLVGWTAFDIAAHGLAQRYFVQSLRLAQAAADRGYGSYVLVTMSRQAVHLGHGREAVQLARVAQQGVGGAAPHVVQSLLHSAEARGHAALDEPRAAEASLARAEQAMADSRPSEEVPHWALYFDESRMAADFAHACLALRQYRSAVTYAERSLRQSIGDRARNRLLCQVTLAAARLGLGEVEPACTLALEAARAAVHMRSARAIEAVREFEALLEPYRDAPPVRGYRDRVAALG
ncbi:regulator [Streptomyces sp. P38-E01]|uniref:Regulator n=1 Tax=Streptomyces tardus TaxID=2780544 RepID=A0A949NA02_9ACTN|nr:regulator [Streptomyces tardus]MBU7599403.1 regulator [Streptomyces tardus]